MLLVLSGPSGSGKGTIVKELIKRDGYVFSVSATTRAPREGERDGVDYYFVNPEQFNSMIRHGELCEHTKYVNHYYGTPFSYVKQHMDLNQVVLLEIDVLGALQVKERYPAAVLVFLLPPTLEELARRLKKRRTEDDTAIEERLNRAKDELTYLCHYNYLVTTDKLETALMDIENIVACERKRPAYNESAVLYFLTHDI